MFFFRFFYFRFGISIRFDLVLLGNGRFKELLVWVGGFIIYNFIFEVGMSFCVKFFIVLIGFLFVFLCDFVGLSF